MKDIKEKLNKLEKDYLKKRNKIIKKCNHNWIENGYESSKWEGTQWYKCTICGERKGECF